MDEAHVTITIGPRQLERLAYWIVILGLTILLVLSFLKDDTNGSTQTADEADDTANAPPAAAPDPTPVATGPSCSDSTKNQDETDVDCGGNACGKCANDKVCKVASDCVSAYCAAGKCAEAPLLSGKVTLDVTKEYHIESASNTIKVTGIDYKVTNGLDEDLDGYVLKIFVKNKAGTRCLNQETSGTCDDIYVEFSSSRSIASGKDSGLQTQMFTDLSSPRMGWYLIEDNGYDPTDASLDDYTIVAYLYDSVGNEIDGKVVTDSLAVSP